MKYHQPWKKSWYKYGLKKIRKKYFGKLRNRQVRNKLKDINFEIQNMDYKKLYHYGYEDVFKSLKRYNNK
ncbi:MAG: hypothetical protein ACRCXT_23780 [Paraclostridium sp.]